MAMTPLVLVWLGSLAALCSLGLLVNFADRWTGVLVAFVASVTWGLFAFGAWDVIVVDNHETVRSEPILPLVFLGIGLSIIAGLFAFDELLGALGSDVADTDAESLLR